MSNVYDVSILENPFYHFYHYYFHDRYFCGLDNCIIYIIIIFQGLHAFYDLRYYLLSYYYFFVFYPYFFLSFFVFYPYCLIYFFAVGGSAAGGVSATPLTSAPSTTLGAGGFTGFPGFPATGAAVPAPGECGK